MRYILLILFLGFGMGCQTMKAKNQARKGWKRVDKEWFGMQAKAPASKKVATRTPANSGEFMCNEIEYYSYAPKQTLSKIQNWVNDTCDSNKNVSTFFTGEKFQTVVACCFQK